MHERLTSKQTKIVKNLSRHFEKSWRIITYPERYSFEEANKTMDFFKKEGREIVEFIVESVDQSLDSEILNLLDSVFLGLFHRNITIPLEFKPRSPNVN